MINQPKQYSFIFLLFLFLFNSCGKHPSIKQQLEKENKIENAYHFYPSTLRMLNIRDVESFDKLIKDVEKLTFLNLRKDSFSYEKIQELSAKLQEEENYEVYLEMENENNRLYILGKTGPDKTIALADYSDRYYIIDMRGIPNLLELPNVMEEVAATDSTQVDGFSLFFDMIQEDADREERWRKRRKERQEERAKMEKEKLEAKSDSIVIDSVQLE